MINFNPEELNKIIEKIKSCLTVKELDLLLEYGNIILMKLETELRE